MKASVNNQGDLLLFIEGTLSQETNTFFFFQKKKKSQPPNTEFSKRLRKFEEND